LKKKSRVRLFENRVLKKIFRDKRVELQGVWKELHSDELNDLYSSQNIVRVNKSIRVRWVGHVARMGRGELYIDFWWENLKECEMAGHGLN
jgi:hypothetical protein